MDQGDEHGPSHHGASAGDGVKPAPDLGESLRQVGAAGRAGFDAVSDAAKALRILVTADISLARSAFGRTLAFTGVAIAFGASAWLLLMATLIVFLHDRLAWSWAMSLLVTALLSLVITAICAWQGMSYFEHTRLQATRRQFARLGIGELADYVPEPGSTESSRESTDKHPPEGPGGEPVKKGLGIDVTPP